MSDAEPRPEIAHPEQVGGVFEVFGAFLKLGLTSFGGPIAHLGYFREEFVARRKWLDERAYSDLVALCQFLPGASSSQVSLALGLGRAGWAGAFAAWLAFTMPSAIALILFAYSVERWATVASSGVVHGLKVMAVAVVAQAVWGMARHLCPDRQRAAIGFCAALGVMAAPSALGQLGAIAFGAAMGRWVLRLERLPPAQHRRYPVSRRVGALMLVVFAALLVLLPLLASATGSTLWSAIAAFYRAGALVFGGGHVILPLLEAGVVQPGWISSNAFLAGYGAAQAVPGPLFTFAAYLGAAMPQPLGGWQGGLILLLAIFAPAFLLVSGALPFWEQLRQRPNVQRATAGVNAAVVGILGAALYDPVWTSAIHTKADLMLALAAFALLVVGRLSPVWVVILSAVGGGLMSLY